MSQSNDSGCKIVIICSSWSSGSTAVTGYLDLCGAYTCPPHINTNDVRTPNSYESKFFRNLVASVTDEFTLKNIGSADQFKSNFKTWIVKQVKKANELKKEIIVLKHPLSSFLLEEIDSAFLDIKYVVVTRKFEEIEKSRVRRGWSSNYGWEGANKIYNNAYTFLHENEKRFFVVPYKNFLHSAESRVDLLNFIGLEPTKKEKQIAEKFITR